MQRKIRLGLTLSALLSLVSIIPGRAAEPVLQENDLLAVCGDSITEQKTYSAFIEDYLLMCKPVAGVRVMQFGWGGDTANGFVYNKLKPDVLRFKPNVMTTCYGMNDGQYRKLVPEVAEQYRKSMQSVIDIAKKDGVRTLVIGAPGCVDTDAFRRDPKEAAIYNTTLASLSDIAKELAQNAGLPFADVHNDLKVVMAKAKAKYGANYPVCGYDGVHPPANGHLVMAYSFLKAMGFDGNIGTITVDLAAQQATATEGHKVLSSKVENGAVEVESSRYPFCFTGKPEDPNGTAGIIEFFPFNQDLNRFTLVVKNAAAKPEDKLKVTWGQSSKDYTAGELSKGINLAAEFLENPFSGQFKKVHEAVVAQQEFETSFIKDGVFHMETLKSFAKEENKAGLDKIFEDGSNKDKALFTHAAEAVIPVKYTITITPVN